MAKIKLGSAGVTSRELDLTGPTKLEPTGVPAGIIGTSKKGPAFIPVTVGNVSEFFTKFGTSDGKKFGPIAAAEWLKNAQSLTYLRVLGVGDGLKRNADDGSVNTAGFIVGEKLPHGEWGGLSSNPYASGDVAGRTYFLGTLMSASTATPAEFVSGTQPGPTAVPVLRGIIMAPSGVVISLSSSLNANNTPSASPTSTSFNGSQLGSVVTQVATAQGTTKTAQFTLLLNGHTNTIEYPNVITASFDPKSGGGYFGYKLNTDPYKIEQAGHCLYSYWNMPGFEVTGSGLLSVGSSATNKYTELSAFILTGSCVHNSGTLSAPNYENFSNRFTHAKSPWVISQKFGGKNYNLFRLHAIDAGAGSSGNYKFSIENLTPSSDKSNLYGTFDLLVREWGDLDTNKRVVERYSGISLDPSSDRYIAKVIGDMHTYYDFDRDESSQKLVVEGNYPNASNIIRVEIHDDLETGNVDPQALPVGFRGVYHTVTSGSSPLNYFYSAVTLGGAPTIDKVLRSAKEPPVPFRMSVYEGTQVSNRVPNPAFYWGVAFEEPRLVSNVGTQLSKKSDDGVKNYTKYFPDFKTDTINFVVGDNEGTADSVENGTLDADRFNNNLFSLENVLVYTASLSGLADSQRWADSSYVRSGAPGNSTSSPRPLDVSRDLTTENRRYAKFTFFMQGGFDGVNIFDYDESNINNYAVECDLENGSRGFSNGPNARAYVKALEVMKNGVNVDIKLLAVPGIRNEYVTNTALTATEERFDAMYLMDIWNYDLNGKIVTSSLQTISVQETSRAFTDRGINSSFAAAYFPDVAVVDPTLGTSVDVPPSVVVLGALALNDAVGHPWFAPAGFARGSLPTTLEPKVKLSKLNQDVLYDANINPLVQFATNPVGGTAPTGNVVVWGQKTLLAGASALDRVNVRRLLIEIRRQVKEIAQTILFEPNRAATLSRFSAAVTPRLQRIQALSGLERFKVIIDSSTTTQADVENNTIRGKIYVQPTKVVEFVSLDFVVSNNIQ